MAIGDLDGHGNPDLVVGDTGLYVSILFGKGGSSFGPPVFLYKKTAGASTPISVAVGDFNGDGKTDMTLANFMSGSVSILINTTFTENTPAGSGVTVQPVDSTTGGMPVMLTFAQVTQGGTTSLITGSSGPQPPASFQLGSPPTYYQLTTTARYSGPITICVNYGGVSFTDPSQLQLFHFENRQWVNVTTSLDTANSTVCGAVSSLSPFAVFMDGVGALATQVKSLSLRGGNKNSLLSKLEAARDSLKDGKLQSGG